MTTTQKRTALTAGMSLLVMAVIAGMINFGIVEQYIDPAHAALTAENLQAHTQTVRLGVLGFSFVILLDFIVAWSLYYLFKSVNEQLARLMSALRIVGATIFAASLPQLWQAAELAGSAPATVVAGHAQTFVTGWNIGLAYFGIHLILAAVLLVMGRYSKIVATLLGLAGVDYILDTAIVVLAPQSEFRVSVFTFVGELLLMIWLLVKAKRG